MLRVMQKMTSSRGKIQPRLPSFRAQILCLCTLLLGSVRQGSSNSPKVWLHYHPQFCPFSVAQSPILALPGLLEKAAYPSRDRASVSGSKLVIAEVGTMMGTGRGTRGGRFS